MAYLTAAEPAQLTAASVLMSPILQTLPAAATSTNDLMTPSATSPPPSPGPTVTLSTFLTSLTPLATTHPSLFGPHLPALVSFLPGLILPPVLDEGVTPTPLKSNPTRPARSFTFPPVTSAAQGVAAGRHGLNLNTSFSGTQPPCGNDDDESARELRLTSLEFMLSLSEAKPSMAKRVEGWVSVMVRACLEGMGGFDEDENQTELREWLAEDV